MRSERIIRQYRGWYGRLLRLYPAGYYARFGEQMEQTFADVLRERGEDGRSVNRYALWMLADTVRGIIKQKVGALTINSRLMLRPAIMTAALLLIPYFIMKFNLVLPDPNRPEDQGFNWTLGDFVFMGALVFTAGFVFEFIASRSRDLLYRAGVALATLTAFLLVWVNLAVGFIGDDNPANVLYLLMPLMGLVGAGFARFKPEGMSRTLFALAAAQMVIPVIAVTFWSADFAPGVAPVFGLSAIFALMWMGAGLLIQQASLKLNTKKGM